MSVIDLANLPSPQVVEVLNYEQILDAMRLQMNGLQPLLFTSAIQPVIKTAELITAENGEQYFKVPASADSGLMYLELESDPSTKQLEIAAYREMLIRNRVNQASLAVMLAFSTGSDLEQLAALFGVSRLLLTPANNSTTPPTPAVHESDTSLRRRTQLALEGFSTAGPVGAYQFHALSASAQVKAVNITAPKFSRAELTPEQEAELPAGAIVLQVDDDAGLNEPMPGDVAVTVLATTGSGVPSSDLLDQVEVALNADDIRPLTDRPRIRGAEILEYQIVARLTVLEGPDTQLVIDAAYNALDSYVDRAHALGSTVTLSAIYASLHQPGVARVSLTQPVADIEPAATQAAYCTGIELDVA